MRRLLGLETLLNTDQEILGAFPGNPKLHRDDFEWFGLMHICFPGWNCSTGSALCSASPRPAHPACQNPYWDARYYSCGKKWRVSITLVYNFSRAVGSAALGNCPMKLNQWGQEKNIMSEETAYSFYNYLGRDIDKRVRYFLYSRMSPG